MLGIFRYKFWKFYLIVIIVMICELYLDRKEKDERFRYFFI